MALLYSILIVAMSKCVRMGGFSKYNESRQHCLRIEHLRFASSRVQTAMYLLRNSLV